MTARIRRNTARSKDDQESVPMAKLGLAAPICEPCAVRRSSRLRHRTSPYFQVVKTNQRAGTSSAVGACRKRSTVKNAIDGGKNASSARTRPPAKRRRKSSSASPQVKSEVDVKEDPHAEAVRVHGLARRVNFYGLIQEIVTPNVFRLLVATCLLNQTKGRAAMPVFWELLRRWPDEHTLAQADVVELTDLLQPIGLHNIRARRLISMAQMMVEVPYDENNSFKSRDRTAPDTPIGIYPGVGRYAIDSWRIFVAGGGASVGLQGDKPTSPFDTASVATCLSGDGKTSLTQSVAQTTTEVSGGLDEPEWKSVMPLDKELRAYLIWRWAKEGQVWDPLRGLVATSPG